MRTQASEITVKNPIAPEQGGEAYLLNPSFFCGWMSLSLNKKPSPPFEGVMYSSSKIALIFSKLLWRRLRPRNLSGSNYATSLAVVYLMTLMMLVSFLKAFFYKKVLWNL